MPRKVMWILIAIFVVTRLPTVWLALNPDAYEQDGINTSSDVDLYEGWAKAMVVDGQSAYADVRIEYPPGSLPVILTPQVLKGLGGYLNMFVIIMLLVDAAAVLGLFLLAKRWGSIFGILLWILAVPALGPIAYLRLDLIPAVATIWALERASADDWMGGGGWIGVGAIAKLYPLVFIPTALVLAKNRSRFAMATAIVFITPLLPLLPFIGDVASSVFGYHSDRGIQVESLWGGFLFLALKGGSDLFLGYSFGALHFDGALAETFKTMGTVASLAVVGFGVFLAFKAKQRDRSRAFAEISFVVLALLLITGTVFSPQFLLWLLALAGAVACMSDSRLRHLVFLLIPIMALSQVVFPFLYSQLVVAGDLPVTVLLIRNALALVLALGSAVILWLGYRKSAIDLSTPEPVSA